MARKFEHKDIIGQLLLDGDIVAYGYGKEIALGRIVKQTEKMIRVVAISTKKRRHYTVDNGTLRYPKATIKIESSSKLLFFILSHSEV